MPGGGRLATLADARAYVLELGDDVRGTRTWEIALQNLLHAAEEGGPWVEFARISLALALTNPDAVIDKPPRKQPTRRR